MIDQSRLEEMTRGNDSTKIPRRPLSVDVGGVAFNVATDGVAMILVPSDGTVWEPAESVVPSLTETLLDIASALFNSVSWRGTMDVLLLKEMVGEAQFGTRPKRMVGDALYIDGSYFDPFYIARALHWWSDLVPAAFFGRLIWKEEDNGTTRVDTTCRALVLASEYMRVAISPIEGYGDSSVTYPASATIYQL